MIEYEVEKKGKGKEKIRQCKKKRTKTMLLINGWAKMKKVGTFVV